MLGSNECPYIWPHRVYPWRVGDARVQSKVVVPSSSSAVANHPGAVRAIVIVLSELEHAGKRLSTTPAAAQLWGLGAGAGVGAGAS
jgi:hypothetical protein